MSEAAAVLLDRSLRLSEHETALEVGWLLAELEQRFGYGLDELARRFDRSVSWVSRRLALVEVLPEAIQQQVREGQAPAQVALKYLAPVARQSLKDCQRMRNARRRGGDLRSASLRYASGRPSVCRLAPRLARDPQAHPRRAGAVFQSAEASAGESHARGWSRTVARSGDGGGHVCVRAAS